MILPFLIMLIYSRIHTECEPSWHSSSEGSGKTREKRMKISSHLLEYMRVGRVGTAAWYTPQEKQPSDFWPFHSEFCRWRILQFCRWQSLEFCRWRNSLAKAVFKQAWHCSFGFLEFSRFSDGLKLIALLYVAVSFSRPHCKDKQF